MSEQLLKALMELFAIIARPEGNKSDRRTVVEFFLGRQLNQELVKNYLVIFDQFYAYHQTLHSERGDRRIVSDSVKVLKICDQINKELTQRQKIIMLVQLFEFVNSDDDEITNQEFEFIATVSDTFHVAKEEFLKIREFTISSFNKIPDSDSILIIDNNKKLINRKVRHLFIEQFKGHLRILHIASANMYFLRYMGAHELYLNGQLLGQEKVNVFHAGSSIRNHTIRPIYYSDVVSIFHREARESRIVFDVMDISYKFKNDNVGLQKMSFSSESGKLIGIMGASGAGKSTLLNVLNGSEIPHTGAVYINEVNIHAEKEKIEGLIGHVSQDDLLIEELTVYQNLFYNAKLCFDNYTEDELVEAVENVLQNLGLFEIKDIQVGSPLNKMISGGQRKRLNIALELIREPGVLFLDEPTSGLSSRDSENIMDLLKELSLKGKLVIVVIHQPSSDIFKMFDKLLILDTGGYLIYKGDPIESIVYFKSKIHHANYNESECHACGNVNPEQIFNIVESNVLDEYGNFTHTRKVSPKEWHNYYIEYAKDKTDNLKPALELPKISFKIPNGVKQFFIYAVRDILSKLSNTQYLIINLLEAPLLAFILSFIIKYYNISADNESGYTFNGNSNVPVYLFISVIIAIFIGLTVSAEEIIKDRKILKREAFLNLSRSSYLLSKIAVLMIISAVQAFTFVIVGNSIIEIKGMYLSYWIVLFSCWVSANILGLVISDSFKTVVTIYILIPFLVIPQIVLSGVIVKYEKLNPSISSPSQIPFYGEIMTAKWGYEALAVHQFINNKYMADFYQLNKVMSNAEYVKNYWIKELQNKIDFLEKYYKDPDKKGKSISYLTVLRNEIGKEMGQQQRISYTYKDSLYYNKLTMNIIKDTKEYIQKVNRLYIKVYNRASERRDKVIRSHQLTEPDKEKFKEIKRNYHNDKLAEFVTNTNEIVRIVEYRGNLYRKLDPVYLDPEHKFIKAHFYAPNKNIFRKSISTYWVNVGVIWFMSILFYIILYFKLLKKFLEFFETLSGRFKRRS